MTTIYVVWQQLSEHQPIAAFTDINDAEEFVQKYDDDKRFADWSGFYVNALVLDPRDISDTAVIG